MSLHVTFVFGCSQLSAPYSKRPMMAMRATLVSQTELEKGRMKMLSTKDSGGWRNRNAFLLQTKNWPCISTLILAWWTWHATGSQKQLLIAVPLIIIKNETYSIDKYLTFRSYLTKCKQSQEVHTTEVFGGTEISWRTLPLYLKATAARCSFPSATDSVGVSRKKEYVSYPCFHIGLDQAWHIQR